MGTAQPFRRILTIFPFGDGGHRRSSGGSFDTRATKAALLVAGNREKSAATCALLCGRTEGGRRRPRERVMQMQARLGEWERNVIAVLLDDNEQQVRTG